MDRRILLGCMILAKRNRYLGKFLFMIVKFSSVIYFLLYIITGIALISAQNPRLILYLAVPLICAITSYCLRFMIKRQRPYKKYKYKLRYGLVKKNSYSFPSNHSVSSVVISMALLYAGVPFWLPVLILAFLTGLSRVFSGLHYPSDVLFGWMLAIFFGFVGFYILPNTFLL